MNAITIQDVLFAFSTAMDLSIGDTEEAIKAHAEQTNSPLDTARDWLDVADSLWVML